MSETIIQIPEAEAGITFDLQPVRYPFMTIHNPDLTMLFVGRVAQAGDRVRLVCTHADGENLTLQLEVIED